MTNICTYINFKTLIIAVFVKFNFIPTVSNSVNEYDVECLIANSEIGRRATVTGSDPV